jgi:hypothetical protein
VYEAALRRPLGRQYNPDAAFRALTRPAVLKSTGVVIQPLRYSKPVEQYAAMPEARARAVVTIAGGMPLNGSNTKGAGGAGPPKLKKKAGAAGSKQQDGAGMVKARLSAGGGKARPNG